MRSSHYGSTPGLRRLSRPAFGRRDAFDDLAPGHGRRQVPRAELRLLVPNTEVPDLAERFEDALLREVPGEVEAWLTALPAMVKTTTAPQQRQSTPREQQLQAHAADLLARVAEVSAARMPENVKLANDNLAWLDMNHREFTRERERLAKARAELGQEASWLDLVGRPA